MYRCISGLVIVLLLSFASAPIASAQSTDEGEAEYAQGNRLRQANDYPKALAAFEAAADKGHVKAMIAAGQMWCNGFGGITASQMKALAHFQSAAMAGDTVGAEHASSLMSGGACSTLSVRKFDSVPDSWFSWFDTCYEKSGNLACRLHYGVFTYRTGSPAEGIAMVSEASVAGYEEADLYLKMMSPEGPRFGAYAAAPPPASSATPAAVDYSKLSVADGWAAYEARDYGRAYAIFKVHSDRGDADAYLGLGNMYEFGHGVGRNASTAMRMYYNAMDKGDTVAKFLYGYLIHSGQAWSSSDGKHQRIGIRFVREAASAGLPAAKDYLEQVGRLAARDNARFQARLRDIGRPCSDTYIRGETSDGRRYKVMRCD